LVSVYTVHCKLNKMCNNQRNQRQKTPYKQQNRNGLKTKKSNFTTVFSPTGTARRRINYEQDE